MVAAFFVLCLSTRNLIVALICTYSITSILGLVMASFVVMGWEFGAAESISAIINVGLVVD